LFIWYYVLCHAHTHLARDASAIEWCLKSTATGKSFWGAWTDLASAYAWRGQKADAAAAVAELLQVRPSFTVETLAQDGAQYSDNPTFRKEFERIVEGAGRLLLGQEGQGFLMRGVRASMNFSIAGSKPLTLRDMGSGKPVAVVSWNRRRASHPCRREDTRRGPYRLAGSICLSGPTVSS
jgi:hypothetical protein